MFLFSFLLPATFFSTVGGASFAAGSIVVDTFVADGVFSFIVAAVQLLVLLLLSLQVLLLLLLLLLPVVVLVCTHSPSPPMPVLTGMVVIVRQFLPNNK